jgi:hypothetical protein
MHYRRLRQEAEPPHLIVAATESLFGWIGLAGRGMTATLADLSGRIKHGVRRMQGRGLRRR